MSYSVHTWMNFVQIKMDFGTEIWMIMTGFCVLYCEQEQTWSSISIVITDIWVNSPYTA